jgi:hypothetical protein
MALVNKQTVSNKLKVAVGCNVADVYQQQSKKGIIVIIIIIIIVIIINNMNIHSTVTMQWVLLNTANPEAKFAALVDPA